MWETEVRFRVREPTSGGWFTYDLEIWTGCRSTLYTDLEYAHRWWHYVWHWIARPVRRWRR